MTVGNNLSIWGWVCFVFLFALEGVSGTTIQPYANLGEVAKSSKEVVLAKVLRNYEFRDGDITYMRSSLQITESLKGNLAPSAFVEVQRWERKINDQHLIMWGDVELHEETTYLLFLEHNSNGTYRPICFSYYLHEEITRYGKSYLVPSEHAKEFETISSRAFEAPRVFLKDDLLNELSQVIQETKQWDVGRNRTNLTLQDFYPYRLRRSSGPGHCSFLTSGSAPLRWEQFLDRPVMVRYTPDDTTGCAQANGLVQACVSSLNSNYPGVNLADGGEIPYMANCFNFSAVGYNYADWIDENLNNGSRNIIVQYDDPCNEFTSLDGCSGVIAVGGVYNVGTHEWKGEEWRSGGYGYVILNEGAAECFCGSADSKLADILEHELTHALGLGHIQPSSGEANMNPGCCHDITVLDQHCVNHSYLSGALLPIALTEFQGKAQQTSNQLTWHTSFEKDVAAFVLERARGFDEHQDFETIAQIVSQGDTDIGNRYVFQDHDPPAKALYRLRSVDLDGEQDLSHIIVVQREEDARLQIYPSTPEEQIFVRRDRNEAVRYAIASTSGQMLGQGFLTSSMEMISVGHLPQGSYYLNVDGEEGELPSVHLFFKL